MPHTHINIDGLSLYDRDGRKIDLVTETDDAGNAFLKGMVYFQPLSVALYDNQNFYLLKKRQTSAKYYGGDILSATDVVDRYFVYNVAFPNGLAVGQVMRELSTTSSPVPHIDGDPSEIAWTPVYVAELDPEHSRVKMSKPALAAGAIDFEIIGDEYVFPGENLGDKFVFRWVKKAEEAALQGWPYLVDEAHSVGDYRIYKNRLYKCVTAYVGPYTGNSDMWTEVSVNTDQYGFFVYDVLADQQNYPYVEKVVEKRVTYSHDHVGFRYPLEFNVAFNPADEVAYSNSLEVYYVYGDTGEEVKIIELGFYGEGVAEDDRLTAWLDNFGIKFNKYDAMMLKDYDLSDAMPDWNVVNSAMKQMFFNKEQIFPYIGSYRGLANLIAILGFKDIIHVKEYWVNQNPQSVYFNRMLLVDISDMLDDGKIQQTSVLEFNRVVKFDEAMRKTGMLALSYEFTRDSGSVDADGIPVVEETSDMTPSEVFYKLYRLKNKLKNEFVPTNVVIKDIIGEFLYFQRVTPKHWYDQTIIYQNQVNDEADISLYPSGFLYVQSVQPLYERRNAPGAPFPAYTFNYGGADPYESGQRYHLGRMPGLMDAIERYYGEIARHSSISISNDYYWEYGDDAETPLGCPVILSFDVEKLTIGDVSGRRLSDFLIGSDNSSQPYFSAVEYPRQMSPLQNQWSEITVNPQVVYGHIYTHNISIKKVIDWPALADEPHEVGDRRSYNSRVYECIVAYDGPYVGNEYKWREVSDQTVSEVRTYTYTAGVDVEVLADGGLTTVEISAGGETETFTYPGASLMPRADIAAFIVGLINTSGLPVAATDNVDGTFRIMSSVTDPFTVSAVANCAVTGDTADDVAAGIVAAIVSEPAPAVDAWMTSPSSGTYYVRAKNYDEQYVNMFESASSYYTLENVDYLNMYELEWAIRRIGGEEPYSFSWRGLVKDLHRIAHVLPYAGEYDVSARAYDFFGGATMSYKPRLIKVLDRQPEIMVLAKYEDKFDYRMSNLHDVMLQDCGSSEMYDPNILMRNAATSVGNLRVGLLDWDFYRRSMYAYDISTDSGVMLWDTTLDPPQYVPWAYCNHPRKNDWGVNTKFNLTSSDFPGARLKDLYFWKLKNTVFNADFLAGFRMWNPAPFDRIIFGRSVASPDRTKLQYVCPQMLWARAATVSPISLSNVNTVDGVPLSSGDVVLVKTQLDDTQNGVYFAVDMGGYFSLQRDPRCDTAYKTANTFVVVLDGTMNGLTCWRTTNYGTSYGDAFADAGMSYYQCAYSNNYVQGSPFDYMAALSDVIGSEQHPIMGLFSSHVIFYGYGSPQTRMMHVTARNFDKYAYQYLTYVKNDDTSLWPAIPPEVITGSEYTFYEPHWAYSDSLIQSFETEMRAGDQFLYFAGYTLVPGRTYEIRESFESSIAVPPRPGLDFTTCGASSNTPYTTFVATSAGTLVDADVVKEISASYTKFPNFKREELFLYAPIMDVLNGLTNDSDYFVDNEYMEIKDGLQVGHLPTVIDENYLSLTKTKCFPDGFFIPKHSLMFFGVNNLFAKKQFEWVLTNDVTGEEIVRVTGVPFLVWKFNTNTSYRLDTKVQDKNGNAYVNQLTNFVHVSPGLTYKTDNEVYNSRRYDQLKGEGMMYGVQAETPTIDPVVPPVSAEEGIEFWYVEFDLVVS